MPRANADLAAGVRVLPAAADHALHEVDGAGRDRVAAAEPVLCDRGWVPVQNAMLPRGA